MSAQRKKTVKRSVNEGHSRGSWIVAAAATAATAATAVSGNLLHAGTSTVPAGNSTSLRRTTAASADVPTVSISGSTAMRNFTISPGFTLLNSTAGNSITLGGPASNPGDALTYSLGSSAVLQFAQQDFNTNDQTSGTTQSHSALRVEWHEQGSVEGIIELADGQIDDTIQGNLLYNPTVANPTWINRNKFTIANTLGGHQLANNVSDNARVAQAQSPVQMAISDVTATQGFAKGGVANDNNGAYTRTPSDPGYGMGNKFLPIGQLGQPGVRFQLRKEEVLNMPAGATDPNGGTYGTGAWNTAGVANLNSRRAAITATLFAANPGTGLTRINRGDAQWLQMTGRLKNGADFNMTTRDVGSGTRNVAALNTGVDPSWAAGENDLGNGNNATGGTDQTAVGPAITFSNKTAGGGQLRPTVQRSRMAVGTLGMSDGIGSFNNTNNAPLRALDYRDDIDDLANNSNGAAWKNWNEDGAHLPVFTSGDLPSNTFVRASATNITNGSYVVYQNEQYVTVRVPNVTDYATDKVKGDNAGHDVADVRDNILNSSVTFGTGTSVATPADSLLDNSFILPQFMLVNKEVDGLNQSAVNATYNSTQRQTFIGDSRAAKFNPADPSTIMTGSGALYGANAAHVTMNPDGSVTNTAPVGGSIPINANNWLFGDFDQTGAKKGIRDFSDLAIAQQAQAALFNSGLGTDWDVNAGSNSSTAIAGAPGQLNFTASKGDLIALGDFNSDGKFDGKDLYLMARGAALADNTSSTTLTAASGATFGDMLRNGVLRKNAALDLLDSTATAQQKLDVTSVLSGANAFNKRDVNRDGLVNFVDAVTSDKFFGKNYTNLDDQLAATGDVYQGATPTPFSLVDAELNDTGNIDQSDLDVINPALSGAGSETWSSGTLVKNGAGSISATYGSGTTVKVNPGATLLISAGTVNVGGTADLFTDDTGTATNGNHVSVINNSTASFNITAGSKAITTLTGTGNASVSAGASLTADHVRQNTLTVNGTLAIRSAGSANSNPSVLNNLSVGGSGKLDLSNQDLIVHNGSGVEALIASGRSGGWTGNGIVTSQSAATTSNLTSIGNATAAQVKGIAATATAAWNGQTVTGSDTLVMYTYGGDANLDGKINVDDYGRIDFNVNLGTSGWFNGDFNYDRKINVDDYGIIDFNVGIQGAPLGSADGLSAGVTAVPEPGSAGLLISALGVPLARVMRRRRR